MRLEWECVNTVLLFIKNCTSPSKIISIRKISDHKKITLPKLVPGTRLPSNVCMINWKLTDSQLYLSSTFRLKDHESRKIHRLAVEEKKDDGHRLINYKNTETKCLLYWCLIEFIDCRYSQSYWYFRTSIVNFCPYYLLQLHLPHTSPSSQSQSIVWTDSVRGGGRCWVVLDTIFCRSLTPCFWSDSESTKLQHHPKQKPRRRGGLRQINTCRKVPLQVNFFDNIWRCFLTVYDGGSANFYIPYTRRLPVTWDGLSSGPRWGRGCPSHHWARSSRSSPLPRWTPSTNSIILLHRNIRFHMYNTLLGNKNSWYSKLYSFFGNQR